MIRKFYLSFLTFSFIVFYPILGSIQNNIDEQIKDQYTMGQKLFYQKRYKKAIELFGELTKKYPDEKEFQYYYSLSLVNFLQFKTWLQRAHALYKFKRFNHALISLEKAKTIYPFGDQVASLESKIQSNQSSHTPLKHLNSKELLFFTNTTQRAKKNLEEGKNETALKLFAESLNLAPQATNALEGYNEAQKRYLAGENQDKIDILLKQAYALQKKNKKIKALAKYRAVLRFDPANRESINKINELEKEISDEKILSEKRALAKQYKRTGQKFVKEKKFQEAIEQYGLGNSLFPSYARWEVLVKEANVLQKIADEKEKKKLNQEVERNYNLGLAFVASEKYRNAITSFQQVVTDAKKLQRTFMVEQATNLLNKITKVLIEKEKEAVSSNSPYYNLIESLKTLGLKALEKSEFGLAQKNFSQILDLFPYNRFANQYLAVCTIKIDPKTKERIMQDFIKAVKDSLNIKKAIKAQRILDVIIFIDKNYKGVKELEALIGKNTQRVIGSSTSNKKLKVLWDKALTAQKNGNTKKAIQIGRQILRLNPSHVNARSLLGRLESGSIVRVAPANIPASAKKSYTQGILHYNTGALKLALGSFRTAIQIYPNYRKASIAFKKCQQYLAVR